jgi:Flp pilus assembly protein protease CpaA
MSLFIIIIIIHFFLQLIILILNDIISMFITNKLKIDD